MMKTFKLKSLQIIEDMDGNMLRNNIELIDGLIINKETERNSWLIEAYIEKKYYPYFSNLQQNADEIIVEVKITTETNEPATLFTKFVGINKFEEKMDILLMGKIVDGQKGKIEQKLKKLIEEGYEGEALFKQFKLSIHDSGA